MYCIIIIYYIIYVFICVYIYIRFKVGTREEMRILQILTITVTGV